MNQHAEYLRENASKFAQYAGGDAALLREAADVLDEIERLKRIETAARAVVETGEPLTTVYEVPRVRMVELMNELYAKGKQCS